MWITLYRAGSSVDGVRVLGTMDRADTALFLRVQLSGDDSIAFDVSAAPIDAFREGWTRRASSAACRATGCGGGSASGATCRRARRCTGA